jgi:hypothetical protein
MTTQTPALYALQHVTTDRLLKASEALATEAWLIRFASKTETEISAFVLNGDAKEYSVVLTPSRAFCGCKDSMYRKEGCRQAAALALFAIRTPDEPQEASAPVFNLKLGKVRAEHSSRSAV